jgi:hypothetical protein
MKQNDHVGWKWANGIATGVISDVRPEKTEIVSKGARVVRNGTPDDPAIIIKQDNGTEVLKLAHEVQVLTEDQEDKTHA